MSPLRIRSCSDANGDGVVLCHTNYYIWGNDLTYLGNYCNGNYAVVSIVQVRISNKKEVEL